MSNPRYEVHQIAKCIRYNLCDEMDDLLNQVEDDRAHAEAERLRLRAKASELGVGPFAEGQRELIIGLADLIDPYVLCDGELVRKSDGTPVTL